MSSSRQEARTLSAYPSGQVAGREQDESDLVSRPTFESGASDPPHGSVSPQAERARRIAAAARARTARIRSAGFSVETRPAPRAGADVRRAEARDDGTTDQARRTGVEGRVDRPAATVDPQLEPERDRYRAPRAAATAPPGPGLNDAPGPAPLGIERAIPPKTGPHRPTVGGARARAETLKVEVPAMPAQAREHTTASGGGPAGDVSAPWPYGPAPRTGNGVAGGRFARTRQAVEAERLDAEGGRAWSHVLRTPEEIGATQGTRVGRLLRRLFRVTAAAQPAAGPPPVEGAIGGGTSGVGGFGRRPSKTTTGGGRRGMTSVLALGTGALVTGLLFGSLLGLPDNAPTPAWVSWPFGQEERPATPAASGEVVIAGLPEIAGQGGPEVALGPGDDSTKAVDVAARAARSQPAVSDLVAVAGSAQETWRQYYRLGHRLHAGGDLRGAVEMYQQAAGLKPDNADTFYDWARALQMLGDRDAAIEKYRVALELAPDSPTGADARARLSELGAH